MLLFSKKFIITSLIIAIFYVIFAIYLMNYSTVISTVFGNFPIDYKLRLLFFLLEGMWTAMSHTSLFLLTLIAFLTGANLTLLWQKIAVLRHMKGLHLVVGGNSLLGIVGSGCAACGLPILSLVGLSGSLIYLPFHGAELSYLAVILLSISLFLLVRSITEYQNCVIPVKRHT